MFNKQISQIGYFCTSTVFMRLVFPREWEWIFRTDCDSTK